MRVTVSLSDEAMNDAKRVLDAAAAVGFRLETYLDTTGIAIGEIESGAADKLRSVDGILAVEPEGDVTAFR